MGIQSDINELERTLRSEGNGTGRTRTSGGTQGGNGDAQSDPSTVHVDPIKRRRRRSTNSGKEVVTSDEVATLCFTALTLVAAIRGDHWLKSKEAIDATIAEPLSNILNRYDIGSKIKGSSDIASLIMGLTILLAEPIKYEYNTFTNRQKRQREAHVGNNGVSKFEGFPDGQSLAHGLKLYE